MKENLPNKNKDKYLEHNSFEQDIKNLDNNFANKSFGNNDFKYEMGNKFIEKESNFRK